MVRTATGQRPGTSLLHRPYSRLWLLGPDQSTCPPRNRCTRQARDRFCTFRRRNRRSRRPVLSSPPSRCSQSDWPPPPQNVLRSHSPCTLRGRELACICLRSSLCNRPCNVFPSLAACAIRIRAKPTSRGHVSAFSYMVRQTNNSGLMAILYMVRQAKSGKLLCLGTQDK